MSVHFEPSETGEGRGLRESTGPESGMQAPESGSGSVGTGALLPRGAGGETYWDDAYDLGETTRSWYQAEATGSLRMFESVRVDPQASVIDVGGGASVLVDALLRRKFADLTVLDISRAGMASARNRLGPAADRVAWLSADLRSWRPRRRYDVWHDRALLHFFTSADERADYRRALHQATGRDSIAIIGAFAPDGPEQCSGLPVSRLDSRGIVTVLGQDWHILVTDEEEHNTPDGRVQPFTWVVARRRC